MLDINLNNGKSLVIENDEETIIFTLYDENGQLLKENAIEAECIAEIVFGGEEQIKQKFHLENI